ncbi:MAG TPA: ABC transporter permease [Acidimicrobiales bacterium]|nr:ABC transporter permease [Acidimicrobiales bacterium]
MRPFFAQLRLELALTLRNGESLLLTIGIPVAVLVFFSLVDVLPIDGEAVDFLAPGTLALAVLATAFTNLAISTGFDRSYGVLKRLGATPLGRPRLVAAKGVAVLVVIAVQAAVIAGTALALGWEPEVEPLPLVGAVVLAVAAFTGMALVLAGRARALLALAAANAIFVGLLLLSGMVFPLDELPSGLRAGARSLPSTALTEAVRGALTADAEVPGRVWPVLAIWALAAVALAIALFRWEPSD